MKKQNLALSPKQLALAKAIAEKTLALQRRFADKLSKQLQHWPRKVKRLLKVIFFISASAYCLRLCTTPAKIPKLAAQMHIQPMGIPRSDSLIRLEYIYKQHQTLKHENSHPKP